jgi:hypothetical protein
MEFRSHTISDLMHSKLIRHLKEATRTYLDVRENHPSVRRMIGHYERGREERRDLTREVRIALRQKHINNK